jgi:uncharacterized Zn-finger protein
MKREKTLFLCEICNYGCSEKTNLMRQQMIHMGEKPFKCGTCDYRGSTKSNLTIHERTPNETSNYTYERKTI